MESNTIWLPVFDEILIFNYRSLMFSVFSYGYPGRAGVLWEC